MRKTQEFTAVITKGKKVINHYFLIFYSFNRLKSCRFGISIPRKLAKKAVKRNYYKRQVKNMLIIYLKNTCQAIHSIDSLSHYDLVIIIRPDYIKKNEFKTKQESLYKLFSFLAKKEMKNRKDIYA